MRTLSIALVIALLIPAAILAQRSSRSRFSDSEEAVRGRSGFRYRTQADSATTEAAAPAETSEGGAYGYESMMTAEQPHEHFAIYSINFKTVSIEGGLDARQAGNDFLSTMSRLKQQDKVTEVENLTLTAVSGRESMTQFGRKIAVVTGTTASFSRSGGPSPTRTIRNSQYQNVGTIAQVEPTVTDHGVLLKLTYEASHLKPAEEEDLPPTTSTTSVKTHLLLQPGVPTHVGGISSEDASLSLIVTLETVGGHHDHDHGEAEHDHAEEIHAEETGEASE